MALPISEEELFRSKWFSAALSTLLSFIGVAPIICFFTVYNGAGLWGIPLGILAFAVIFFALVNLCVILIHLGPINNFVMKHIAKLRAAVAFLVSASAFLYGIVMPKISENVSEGGRVAFGPLSKLLSSTLGLIAFVVVLGIIDILIGLYIKKKYAIDYYERTSVISEAQKKRSIEKAANKSKSLSNSAGNHGKSVVDILAQNTVAVMKSESGIMQQTISSIVLPVFMIPSLYQFGIKEVLGKNFLIDLTFCLIFSVFMVLFTYGISSTLPSILVSIDGATFESIKAMPLNLRLYIMSRIKILFRHFIPLPFAVNIGALVFFGAGLRAIIVACVIYLVLSIVVSIEKILGDFINPYLDWTSLNQLYLRDGRIKPVIFTFVVFGVFFGCMGIFNLLVAHDMIKWLLIFGCVLCGALGATEFLRIYWKLSKI